jgi:pimeloyl-ACP methyl ester carboxylesterase
VHRITSRDGTLIAGDSFGAGPPLVLVHGSGGTRLRWRPLLPVLGRHFTVLAVDRRGRGESGDAASYAIEREFEDIAAVVDSCAEPVHLLGHSYGALCSLEAARLTSKLASLVLYEPPLPMPELIAGAPAVIEALQVRLDAGDREGVLEAFLTTVVRMPRGELAAFKATEAWPARVAAAHTLPRELQAHVSYRFQPERFAGLRVPALVLVGAKSPPYFGASAAAVHDALPGSKLVVLSDQQHNAIDSAPELFVDTLLEFTLGRAKP